MGTPIIDAQGPSQLASPHVEAPVTANNDIPMESM